MFETVTTRLKSTHSGALKPQLLPKELQYVCAAGFKGSNSWAIKQMQPVQFCICQSQSEEAHVVLKWAYIYAVGARHALRVPIVEQ